MALSVNAPPFGHCSDTIPSIVGQKNVLPNPYSVAKIKMAATPAADDSMNNPTIASAADAIRSPTGVNFSTIGPAKKNRNTIIIADV